MSMMIGAYKQIIFNNGDVSNFIKKSQNLWSKFGTEGSQ